MHKTITGLTEGQLIFARILTFGTASSIRFVSGAQIYAAEQYIGSDDAGDEAIIGIATATSVTVQAGGNNSGATIEVRY